MFKRRKAAPPSGPGADLRAMALKIDPASLGLTPGDRQVWGFVMDTGMEGGGWYTLVVLADGTASLYTSAAFGVIGAGTHESVQVASRALLALANDSIGLFADDHDDATPPAGEVAMRGLTFSGRRALVAREEELASGSSPASRLFYAAHDVITAIREATPPQ